MATPFPLQREYGGICRDYPRDQLPPGLMWESIDWIPQILGAPLSKRGGWAYGSRALGSTTSVTGLLYAPFAAGAYNLAITSDNHLYRFTSSAETDIGAAVAVAQNPVYHRTGATGLAIIPASGGATAPKSYDRTTLQNLAGSPPAGQYATVWNDYTVLSGVTAAPTTVYFSVRGDAAATWDTTNSVQTAPLPVVGLAAINSSVLAFHARSTTRFRSDKGVGPSTATVTGDFGNDMVFDVGCMDARTIVRWNDFIVWADARGVYMTDGVALKDLTATGLVQTFWRQTAAQTFTVAAAGVINDTYIISLTNAGVEVATFAYDLNHGFWYRLSNLAFISYARTGGAAEECYAGMAAAGRAAALSTIFTPAAAYKNDANGTAVTPYMETGLFRGYQRVHRSWVPSMAIQNWRALWLNYDLRDAASDAPTLTVGYIVDQDATFTSTLPTLAATTKQTRARRDLGFQGHAVAFQVSQTNASATSKFYPLEGWYEPLETGRLSQ